jgi:hypothetical protein
MLGGSWTRAPRMMAALAVALALGAAGVATAADTPNAPASSASPSAAAPPAAAPPAESPPGAPSSAEAPPSAAPPAAAPPPTLSPTTSPDGTSRSATELDGPAPRTQPAAGGSTQSGMAGCAVWTDRCVICQRDSGVVACSNIGIACQPQPLVCLRPEAPEKKPEN